MRKILLLVILLLTKTFVWMAIISFVSDNLTKFYATSKCIVLEWQMSEENSLEMEQRTVFSI